jgi:putative sterol carrier protein
MGGIEVSGPSKFFSPEWCEQAKDVANANEKMFRGFKDPSTFTHKMEFGCTDRDLATHLEWKEGVCVHWGPPTFDPDELWLVIEADVDTWRTAAAGTSEGGQLLMAGKIKFAKGPVSAAIENAGAFNNFLRSWGDVDTDWD